MFLFFNILGIRGGTDLTGHGPTADVSKMTSYHEQTSRSDSDSTSPHRMFTLVSAYTIGKPVDSKDTYGSPTAPVKSSENYESPIASVIPVELYGEPMKSLDGYGSPSAPVKSSTGWVQKNGPPVVSE